jgi:hypothetical protein
MISPLFPHIAVSTDAPRDPAIQDMVTSPDYRHVPTRTFGYTAA